MMTRDEILDAAAQIFRIKGYHATSMSDIAGAVNLQKASLYHHVSSKQEILLELLDRALELLTEEINRVVQNDSLQPDEKLRQMMRAYLKALTDHADLSSVLLMEHRSLEPELHARHIPNRDGFEALWHDVIEEGMQSGVFSCTETSMTARTLLGAMNWTITWFNPKGELKIEDIADQIATLFLKGLRGS